MGEKISFVEMIIPRKIMSYFTTQWTADRYTHDITNEYQLVLQYTEIIFKYLAMLQNEFLIFIKEIDKTFFIKKTQNYIFLDFEELKSIVKKTFK